ncbi:class I SAM-dependent methyltransferase [Deminuibacter soli]|uniref:Class I SAM-dependent methyltransferase n=1 Tax=Deminuibacter soli TaxID=2291815 RepID=A0A3E1NQN6_9BACT|nr:class I SAM-dependent methyltransferase [Deminuibacter soli]RFM30134.1 class I SAM-dependent methyltransferase [Deminuibacter soli]
MSDVLGEALHDYYLGTQQGKLWIHNKYGPKEEMYPGIYFRNEADLPELELMALQHCRGSVLDIGGGAGSHALLLQQRGLNVTALDISPKAVEVMNLRGVRQTVQGDIFTYNQERFDTLLLLMNGIGLAADIAGLKRLLAHFKTLVQPGGQVIFDSSDIAYLYDGKLPKQPPYYGEVSYQYSYKKMNTPWFKWLYVDQQTLIETANNAGWNVDILAEDEYDQYLCKLTLPY